MDTGDRHFEYLKDLKDLQEAQEKFPNHGGVFTVGEELELKGSLFRVKSIKPNRLILKLLKRPKLIIWR